jgi:hypothetical protein
VPLVALAFLLLLPLAVIALMPFILLQRYRTGTARRQARSWVATLNMIAMIFSAAFFLTAAAVTTVWVPGAVTAAAAGMAAGIVLGGAGLLLTKWEPTARALHYTPNRWLVLMVTMVVTARVLYGFVRGWMTWQAAAGSGSFIEGFGVAGSLGAGAAVLGYYLAYGIGLRYRIRMWQRRALRVMNG